MASPGFYFQGSGAAVGAATAALYLAIAATCWIELGRATQGPADLPSARHGRLAITTALMPLAMIGHAVVLGDTVFGPAGPHFGFAHALSATVLVSGAVLWIESFYVPLRGLFWLVTPIAALTVGLPMWFPGASLVGEEASSALWLHLVIAIVASGFVLVAAFHATLMALVDRSLHRPSAESGRGLARLLARVPPLLALETLLFRLIGVGFILLSATLVSGSLFSEETFGRAFHVDHTSAHKLVFTLLAWLVFGALLIGRTVFGWRGRIALRWTLTGFVLLLLGYIGSHFVLEVILHRIA